MNTADADDEADEPGSMAAVGCLRAISTILESVSSLPQLFIQIEPTLLPIMRTMLTTDGQGIYSLNYSKLLRLCFASITLSFECHFLIACIYAFIY